MRIIHGGLLAIALSAPALPACAGDHAAASPGERVYFLGHATSIDGYGSVTMRSFAGLALDRQPDGGHALRTRLLWGAQSGGGQSGNLLQLDPEDPQVRAYLDVLRSGFRIDIDARGVVRGMSAVDQQAWNAVVEDDPRLARMAMPQEQILGMVPRALPDRLQVGQRIVTRDERSQFGRIEWHAEVRQLDDAHVLLDLELKGEQIAGRGRQVVARTSGMPLEAWLELDSAERDDMQAMHQVVYMVDIAIARDPLAMLDDGAWSSTDDYVAGLLAAPPFSAPSDDPAMFALDETAEGALAPWMASPALLEQLDRSAGFVAEREGDAHRPQLRLGGQLAPRRRFDPDTESMPAWQMLRLRGVELLDADGHPIPGLHAIPTVRDWALVDTFGVEESEAGFPFRLPLDATAAQLGALERIVLDAQVETYRWDGVEQVDAGAQPRDTDVRLEWGAPHRMTVLIADDADADEGVWASAVPYDAAGRQIPSTQVQRRLPQVAAGHEGIPVLEWQRRNAPMRLELAAAAPIASVRLQRYRWQWQDHALAFANATRMGEGGPLVGSLQIDEPDPRDLPPASMAGSAILALIRPDGRGDPYRSLRLDAPSDLVGWVVQLCRAESAARGRLQGQARIVERERGPGPGGSWGLGSGAAERGTWNLELDEALLLADDLPATWPVTVACPHSVQRVREPVASSACFSAQGDGWLRIQPACRGRVLTENDLVIGRDADGRRLASVPADSRDHHMRFWGEVAEVEYVLGSEEQVRRLIVLPQDD